MTRISTEWNGVYASPLPPCTHPTDACLSRVDGRCAMTYGYCPSDFDGKGYDILKGYGDVLERQRNFTTKEVKK